MGAHKGIVCGCEFFFFHHAQADTFRKLFSLGEQVWKGGGRGNGDRQGGREGGWDLFRSALELKGNL